MSRSNYYTEPYSEPLRRYIAEGIGVPQRLVHINAGSELILRQIFDRLGQQVHLLAPTYPLFPEIAGRCTETRLLPEKEFAYDLAKLEIPAGTTLAVIVNPNNPNGGSFDMAPLPGLLRRYPHALPGGRGLHRPRRQVGRPLGTRPPQSAGDPHPVQGPQPGGVPRRLRNPARRPCRRPQFTQRRLSPGPAQPGGGAGHPAARRQNTRPGRTTACLDGRAGDRAARTRCTHLSDADLFFLADFAPHDAAGLAGKLRDRGIFIKPLNDPLLGPGFMRVTTALPEDNTRVIAALRELL